MANMTYPPSPARTTNAQTADVHYLLKSPQLVTRRVVDLASQRYVADFLLTGRYEAVGGSIMLEDGGHLLTDDAPEAVAPGASYPLTTVEDGSIRIAHTTKWGQDVPVTDEAIARMGLDPVNTAFNALINQSVKFIDTAAMGVIASAVTGTYDATGAGNAGAWTTGEAIVEGTLEAIAGLRAKALGYNPNVIVMNDVQWARAVGRLVTSGAMPRESENPLTTGVWPQALGLLWVSTPHMAGNNPLLLDNTALGGMADENLGAPGYGKNNGLAVEAKSIRQEEKDRYLLRARRVTVPVVREKEAAVVITNTGL